MIYEVGVHHPAAPTPDRVVSITASDVYQAVEKAVSREGQVVYNSSQLLDFPLSNIVVIHNSTGIRERTQVGTMYQQIGQGQHIVHDSGAPNIKIVIAPDNRPLLFDGHHTALAYLAAGKSHLSDVPYAVVAHPGGRSVSSSELTVLYPESAKAAIESNWSTYVVNWQADASKQLEPRKIETLGQLALALGEADEGTSKS